MIFSLIFTLLFADIEVKLQTDSALTPVYVARVEKHEPAHPVSYMKSVENVLRNDLNHNALTTVAPFSAEREKAARTIKYEQLQDQGLYYLIRPIFHHDTLALNVTDLYKRTTSRYGPVTLTGKLALDRRLVHKLADALHQAFSSRQGCTNTRILYTVKFVENGREIGDVWISDADGANARKVTNDGALAVTPAFIPPEPGKKANSFLYTSYLTGQPKIMIGNLSTGSSQRISKLRGNQLMPAITNKRDKIALISDANGNPDLYLFPMHPETGQLARPRQIFAASHATQASPTFDPTGNKVAFVSNMDGRAKIYLMDIPPAGTPIEKIHPKLLVKRNRECTAPAWSPDGTKLAFTSKVDGARQIFIYDFNTGQMKQLTDGPNNKENPTWAPNSTHLAYNDPKEIYVVDIITLKPKKITSGPGEKRFPAWEKTF